MSRRALPGLRHALSRRSHKNASKSKNYPHLLTAAEWIGMLYGPLAYLRSRASVRAAERSAGAGPDDRLDLVVDTAALTVIAALGSTIAAGAHGPLRELLALVFVTFVPGWALLPHPFKRWSTQAALAIAISLTVGSGASAVMLWLSLWAPTVLFALLAAVSCTLIVPRLLRRVRAVRPNFGWR